MSVYDTLDTKTFCGGRFVIKNHGCVHDRDHMHLYSIGQVRLQFEDVTGRDSIVVQWYCGSTSTVQLDDEQLLPQLQSIRKGEYLVNQSGICFSNLNGFRHRFGMVLALTCDHNGKDALVIEWDTDQPTIETIDKELMGVN